MNNQRVICICLRISSRSSSGECQTAAAIKEDDQSIDGNNVDEVFSVSPVLSVSSAHSAKSALAKIKGGSSGSSGSSNVAPEAPVKSAASATATTSGFPFSAIHSSGYGSHLFPLPHRYRLTPLPSTLT